ncbi:MAG: polysaccharide ABC transporter ATP-binding protein [Pseudohongiellaceae bacterium]
MSHSIRVRNLHKDFHLYDKPQDRLLELVLRRPRHKVFHVLQDIHFEVPEGQSLGIIGDNGAGKSTLMKLLVGTLQPSGGEIDIRGQVAALLELGAGFHPEFTGRRNIHLNASLLGVPDDDIDALEEEIIDFSELHQFIDQPVKTYSSGMYVRLAFSIATLVRPDVLVIDEALSVGDMNFQKKCVQRMNEFRAAKKTMIFCSHSMYHVQELCDSCIWLENGKIREYGSAEEVVAHYEDYCNGIGRSRGGDGAAQIAQAETHNAQDCRILHTKVRALNGDEITEVEPLQDIILETRVEVLKNDTMCYFGFALMQDLSEIFSSYLTIDRPDVDTGPFRAGQVITVQVRLEAMALRAGRFNVLGGLADESGLLWYETRLSPEIHIKPNKGVGTLRMRSSWDVKREG